MVITSLVRRHYPPPQQCAHWGCWQSSNRWPHAIAGVIGLLGGSVDASNDAKNPIFLGGGKWLCRSIFVGKTDLGGRFWQRSGRHDPRQYATTSPKLGESDMNVTYYWPGGQFPLDALRLEIGDLGRGAWFRFVRTFCSFDCCVCGTFMSFFDFVAGNSWVKPLIVHTFLLIYIFFPQWSKKRHEHIHEQGRINTLFSSNHGTMRSLGMLAIK